LKHISPSALFASLAFYFLVIAIPAAMVSQKYMPQATANGKLLFNQSCAACHDTLGTTTKSGPELRNYYRRQPRPADAVVRTIIQQGKGRMPAFSTLNKSQTDELIAYLKTL
jgi:mono/diheme cytochrome c family protein